MLRCPPPKALIEGISGRIFKSKSAFTLAEILITLAIIGIIAALTIPTLVQNQKNKALQSKLKKNYSVLNQALSIYQAENGTRITPKNCGTRELKPILLQYLREAKDCGWGESNIEKSCVKNSEVLDEDTKIYTIYKSYTGYANVAMGLFDDGQFLLPDGSFIMIENNVTHLYISVDLNGFEQGPNRLGQDLFMFQIIENGTLLPMGHPETTYSETQFCSTSNTSYLNGAGCTYKALNNPDFFNNLPK